MTDHEPQDFESCAVCGRSILRGERVSDYVGADGKVERVCSLCRDRAEAGGWIPLELAGTLGRAESQRRGRGLALRERLGRAAERVRPGVRIEREAEGAAQPARANAEPTASDATKRRPAKRAGSREAKPRRAQGDRNGAGSDRKGRRPARAEGAAEAPPRPRPPDTPQRRMRRALDRFNASGQVRTVAGLIRSLGQPQVAVEDGGPRPPRVRITVAWELSWYRWEVELDAEDHGVKEIGKGGDISELEEAERGWNAAAAEDGRLRLEADRR